MDKRAHQHFSLYYYYENNFSSDVAKREDFLPTTHKLTPQLKGEKCQKKKKNSTSYSSWTHVLMQHPKKERKEKEEKEAVKICK
jgi:hypothetical protein